MPGAFASSHEAPAAHASTAPAEAAPSPKPAPQKLTPAEGKKLLSEFQKAQYNEAKALEHRQRSEMKELKGSQKAREKEWIAKESEARKEFFKKTASGAEKRVWMQDRKKRYEAMSALLKDMLTSRAHEHEVRRKSLKDEQAQSLKEFKEAISRGERPAESLWPASGR